MKLNFTPPDDHRLHQYCLQCRADAVEVVTIDQLRLNHCQVCGATLPRALIIDPATKWWIDSSREYWHETAGVFVRHDNRFLLLERTAHPLGLTLPAGHVDRGESPATAATRELFEETGLRIPHLTFIATDDLRGDECRRGADAHRWHIYAAAVSRRPAVTLNGELLRPVWLTLDEALASPLTFATRLLLTKHNASL